MSKLRRSRGAACAVAASLTLGGSAVAAGETDAIATDTTLTVSPRVVLTSPQRSPVAFPGVTRVREGVAPPRGWIVVSRDVQIVRGAEVAFAAFRMTCPKGGTANDDIAASVLDRDALSHKRSVLVLATFATSVVRAGETATGKVFALCR